MTAIGKHDWLLCVRSATDPYNGAMITAGAVYVVAGVGRLKHLPHDDLIDGNFICSECGEWDDGANSIDVLDVRSSPFAAWCACCFRPLSRGPGEAVERAAKVGVSA